MQACQAQGMISTRFERDNHRRHTVAEWPLSTAAPASPRALSSRLNRLPAACPRRESHTRREFDSGSAAPRLAVSRRLPAWSPKAPTTLCSPIARGTVTGHSPRESRAAMMKNGPTVGVRPDNPLNRTLQACAGCNGAQQRPPTAPFYETSTDTPTLKRRAATMLVAARTHTHARAGTAAAFIASRRAMAWSRFHRRTWSLAPVTSLSPFANPLPPSKFLSLV